MSDRITGRILFLILLTSSTLLIVLLAACSGTTGGVVSPSGGSLTGGGSASNISGRVVDGTTNQPIAGAVAIALVKNPPPDQSVAVAQVNADAQGNFTFPNVSPGDYALVISAMNANQSFDVPVLLLSGGSIGGINITPGTNVETIPVPAMPSGGFSGTGSAQLGIFMQTDTATPITLSFRLTDAIGNFVLPFPIIGPSTVTTSLAPQCGGSGCASISIPVPPWTPVQGMFNGPSTHFVQSSVPAYTVIVTATSAATGLADCTPSVQSESAGPVFLGQTNQLTFNFTGCH